MDASGLLRRRGRRSRPGPALGAAFLLLLPVAAWPQTSGSSARRGPDVPGLLREIREEVLGLERYPGEDFARGEFFLGEGDDDTYKTHAVGILVNAEAEGSRMTIVVSRLEPARDNPRIKYAREPRTIACRVAGEAVEILRSDYAPPELEKLLPAVLKAVVDKKALLKKEASCDLELVDLSSSPECPSRGGEGHRPKAPAPEGGPAESGVLEATISAAPEQFGGGGAMKHSRRALSRYFPESRPRVLGRDSEVRSPESAPRGRRQGTIP